MSNTAAKSTKNSAETNALVPAMCGAGDAMLKSVSKFRFSEVIRDLMAQYGYLPAHKPEGAPKNAFCALFGVPKELIDSKTVKIVMKVEDGKVTFWVTLVCEEGDQTVPLDSVIGWGRSTKTRTGYNCWRIDNASETLRVDKKGNYTTKKVGLVLYPVTDVLPAVLENCGIERTADGSWDFPYEWGVNGRQTAFVGKGFWVIDGVDDQTGKPKFHYLGGGSAGSDQTILCMMEGSEYGADICTVADLYPAEG